MQAITLMPAINTPSADAYIPKRDFAVASPRVDVPVIQVINPVSVVSLRGATLSGYRSHVGYSTANTREYQRVVHGKPRNDRNDFAALKGLAEQAAIFSLEARPDELDMIKKALGLKLGDEAYVFSADVHKSGVDNDRMTVFVRNRQDGALRKYSLPKEQVRRNGWRKFLPSCFYDGCLDESVLSRTGEGAPKDHSIFSSLVDPTNPQGGVVVYKNGEIYVMPSQGYIHSTNQHLGVELGPHFLVRGGLMTVDDALNDFLSSQTRAPKYKTATPKSFRFVDRDTRLEERLETDERGTGGTKLGSKEAGKEMSMLRNANRPVRKRRFGQRGNLLNVVPELELTESNFDLNEDGYAVEGWDEYSGREYSTFDDSTIIFQATPKRAATVKKDPTKRVRYLEREEERIARRRDTTLSRRFARKWVWLRDEDESVITDEDGHNRGYYEFHRGGAPDIRKADDMTDSERKLIYEWRPSVDFKIKGGRDPKKPVKEWKLQLVKDSRQAWQKTANRDPHSIRTQIAVDLTRVNATLDKFISGYEQSVGVAESKLKYLNRCAYLASRIGIIPEDDPAFKILAETRRTIEEGKVRDSFFRLRDATDYLVRRLGVLDPSFNDQVKLDKMRVRVGNKDFDWLRQIIEHYAGPLTREIRAAYVYGSFARYSQRPYEGPSKVPHDIDVLIAARDPKRFIRNIRNQPAFYAWKEINFIVVDSENLFPYLLNNSTLDIFLGEAICVWGDPEVPIDSHAWAKMKASASWALKHNMIRGSLDHLVENPNMFDGNPEFLRALLKTPKLNIENVACIQSDQRMFGGDLLSRVVDQRYDDLLSSTGLRDPRRADLSVVDESVARTLLTDAYLISRALVCRVYPQTACEEDYKPVDLQRLVAEIQREQEGERGFVEEPEEQDFAEVF